MHISKTKNLIFDLGGVILNLDVNKTYQHFAKLSGRNATEIKALAGTQSFFSDYEKGLLSDAEFRSAIRQFLAVKVSDVEIDDAWSAMLLDIPAERLVLLERLKATYRVFLLSNTNGIHLERFGRIVSSSTGLPSLDVYFHGVYYSHQIKMRKPEMQIYQFVLQENKLIPGETLFFDDHLPNLEGAAAAGISTFHVQHANALIDYFS